MPSAMVDAARSVAPLARERAALAEAQRHLTADVVAALRSAGLLRMYVPAALGGPEADPLTMLEAVAVVAEADGAAGWCTMIASTTSSLAWLMDPTAAHEVFGHADGCSGGAFAPTGVGRAVDGGIRVDGRWAWGSGTDHCDWVCGGTLVDDGRFVLAFVPQPSVKLVDTWHSSGLRGTASNDFELTDAFVADAFTIEAIGSTPTVDGALGRMPLFSLLASGVAAALCGIARRAVAEVIDLAQVKTPVLASKRLRDWAMTQVELARAEAALAAAWAFLTNEVGVAWDAAMAGQEVPLEQRARIRLACSHAGSEAARAVDLCYGIGGGSSVYETSALQRCFRDVHTGTAHIMVAPRFYETYGKLRLGHDIDGAMV